jgi:hypothetical protein
VEKELGINLVSTADMNDIQLQSQNALQEVHSVDPTKVQK